MAKRSEEEKKAAAREAVRRYQAKNRELIAAKARARRAADVEKGRAIVRESMKRAYAKDPEKYKDRARKWRQQAYADDPAMFRKWAAKRRACKAAISWADEFLIAEFYDLARRRTRATGIQWEVDHIVPLQGRLVCGLHVEHNLRVVPQEINRRKGNSDWPDHPNPRHDVTLEPYLF